MKRAGKQKSVSVPVEAAQVPPEKRAFYPAASRFLQARPWRFASDAHVLGIDVPSLGWSGGCAIVLGKGGRSHGLVLLRSMEDYVRFVRSSADAAAAEAPGLAILTVSFEGLHKLPRSREVAAEAQACGFDPGSEGLLPAILKLDAAAGPVLPTVDDYRLTAVALESVREYVSAHRKLFDTPPSAPVAATRRVKTPLGEDEVTVTAPPPQAPWRWGREQPIDGLHRDQRQQLLTAFGAARVAEGVSDAEAEVDTLAAGELLEYVQKTGRAQEAWSPEQVEAFLLRHYPEFGEQVGERVASLPDRFDAFLRWLAASGHGPVPRLEQARARLSELRAKFVEWASDSRRFSTRKRLTLLMLEQGVDPLDEAAVKGFMQALRRRAAYDPALVQALRPQAARWTWSGEGQPPDPQAACPCGSGRRYRKCCLPR